MTHWWHDRLVNDYFGGRLRVRGEDRMRARLGRCASCRARYRRHLIVEAAMPAGDQGALDRLWQGIARDGGIAPGSAAQAPSSRARFALRGALAVAAAAGILAIAIRLPSHDSRRSIVDPVSRGGALYVTGTPAIHVFRSVGEHAAEPIGAGPIRAGDGLLFAYTNPDPQLTHLMIFAVAPADGQTVAVHWYYPAYRQLGEDPQAMTILPGTTGMELGEEIRHPLRPGPVRIYALFLREPHQVLEIESMIRQVIEEPHRPVTEETRLPLPGSVQSSVLVQVTP
jgi:hypothetical protein